MKLPSIDKLAAKRTSAAIVERALLGVVTYAAFVLIGRWAGKAELGLFAVFFPLVFIAIAIQESLITAPYTVFAPAAQDEKARRGYFAAVLVHSNILGLVCASALAIAAILLAERGMQAEAANAAVLAVATPCVLLREFARRVVYAEMNPAAAVAISGAVGVLQVAFMAAFYAAGWMSSASAFAALGLSSLIGGGAWLAVRRDEVKLSGIPLVAAFRENWTLGKWSVPTQVGEIVRTQMFPWILALAAGTATVGAFAACAVTASLPTPLHTALSNLLIPSFVHAQKRGGLAEVHRLTMQATAWLTAFMFAFAAALAALYVGLATFSQSLIPWIYGDDFQETPGMAQALAVLVAAQVLNGASLPSARALFAIKRADHVFTSQAAGIVVNLALGLPLVLRWGIVGASYAVLIGSALKALLGAWRYWESVYRDDPARSSASPLLAEAAP